MTMATTKQRLDQLQELWTAHLGRPDVTEPERKAYEHALRLIEQARTVAPNKALRVVQNGILLSMGKSKDARDFTPSDSMENWEHQAALDAYRQLREDMAHVL